MSSVPLITVSPSQNAYTSFKEKSLKIKSVLIEKITQVFLAVIRWLKPWCESGFDLLARGWRELSKDFWGEDLTSQKTSDLSVMETFIQNLVSDDNEETDEKQKPLFESKQVQDAAKAFYSLFNSFMIPYQVAMRTCGGNSSLVTTMFATEQVKGRVSGIFRRIIEEECHKQDRFKDPVAKYVFQASLCMIGKAALSCANDKPLAVKVIHVALGVISQMPQAQEVFFSNSYAQGIRTETHKAIDKAHAHVKGILKPVIKNRFKNAILALQPVLKEIEKTVTSEIGSALKKQGLQFEGGLLAGLLKEQLNENVKGFANNAKTGMDAFLDSSADKAADKAIELTAQYVERTVKGYFVMSTLNGFAKQNPYLAALSVVLSGGSEQTTSEVFLRVVGAGILLKTGSGFKCTVLIQGVLTARHIVHLREQRYKRKGKKPRPLVEVAKTEIGKLSAITAKNVQGLLTAMYSSLKNGRSKENTVKVPGKKGFADFKALTGGPSKRIHIPQNKKPVVPQIKPPIGFAVVNSLSSQQRKPNVFFQLQKETELQKSEGNIFASVFGDLNTGPSTKR